MWRVLLLLVVALPFASSALGADGGYKFEVDGTGATGLRYRYGAGEWETAIVSGGVASVSVAEGGQDLAVEWVGVPYGSTTIANGDLATWGEDSTITLGGLSFGAEGASRSLVVTPLEGAAFSVGQAFELSEDAFAPEVVGEMVGVASGLVGVVVGVCCGVFFVWLLIRKGLRWATSAFGGAIAGGGGMVTFVEPEIPGAPVYLHRKLGETDADWLVRKHEHRNRFDD